MNFVIVLFASVYTLSDDLTLLRLVTSYASIIDVNLDIFTSVRSECKFFDGF